VRVGGAEVPCLQALSFSPYGRTGEDARTYTNLGGAQQLKHWPNP